MANVLRIRGHLIEHPSDFLRCNRGRPFPPSTFRVRSGDELIYLREHLR